MATSMPVPFGVDAYRRSLCSEPLSKAEETQLVAAARAGDREARTRLLEDCQRQALKRSLGLAAFYRAMRGVELDPQDIAQEAGVRAWARMDKALASPNPCGYLRLAIVGAMLTFCRERQTAIRVPAPMQSRHGIKPVKVLSLDALAAPIGEEDSGFVYVEHQLV